MIIFLKKNKYIILILFSLFFTILFTVKKYFFSIGLIFLGFLILFFPMSFLKKKTKLIFLIIQIGLLFIFAGISYTLLNIIDKIQRTSFANSSQLNSFKTFYYDQKKDLVKKTHESGKNLKLGYRFKPNSKFNVIKKNETENQVISFDVIYTINKFGNRKTYKKNNSKKSTLFLGDSTTFGVGLNDYETLPSHFSRVSSLDSINAGLMGYGTHQVLKILEDDDLYREKSEGKNIDKIIYRLLPNHINRAAGYVTWDKYGPCYDFDLKKNKIIYKGSFEKCLSDRFNFRRKIANILFYLGNNEPITYRFGKDLLQHNYQKEIYDKKDYERFLKILDEINKISKKRNASLYIIMTDLNRSFGNKNPCKINNAAQKIGNDIKNMNINVIFTSTIHNFEECKKGFYDIKFDGHPSSKNNKELAIKIYDWINNLK